MPLKPYNMDEELQAIQRRYERIPKEIPFTLERLKSSKDFQLTIQKLHTEENWKDWHILLALFNAVLNWHVEVNNALQNAERARSITQVFNKRGERMDDPPVPMYYFEVEKMKHWLNAAIALYIDGKGAEPRKRGYDFAKLRKIIEQRYHYFELDIPHDSIF